MRQGELSAAESREPALKHLDDVFGPAPGSEGMGRHSARLRPKMPWCSASVRDVAVCEPALILAHSLQASGPASLPTINTLGYCGIALSQEHPI